MSADLGRHRGLGRRTPSQGRRNLAGRQGPTSVERNEEHRAVQHFLTVTEHYETVTKPFIRTLRVLLVTRATSK